MKSQVPHQLHIVNLPALLPLTTTLGICFRGAALPQQDPKVVPAGLQLHLVRTQISISRLGPGKLWPHQQRYLLSTVPVAEVQPWARPEKLFMSLDDQKSQLGLFKTENTKFISPSHNLLPAVLFSFISKACGGGGRGGKWFGSLSSIKSWDMAGTF